VPTGSADERKAREKERERERKRVEGRKERYRAGSISAKSGAEQGSGTKRRGRLDCASWRDGGRWIYSSRPQIICIID